MPEIFSSDRCKNIMGMLLLLTHSSPYRFIFTMSSQVPRLLLISKWNVCHLVAWWGHCHWHWQCQTTSHCLCKAFHVTFILCHSYGYRINTVICPHLLTISFQGTRGHRMHQDEGLTALVAHKEALVTVQRNFRDNKWL